MAKASTPYSDVALRERLKKKILAASKGGRAGQWSARKAQLLAAEYKKAGGTYTANANPPKSTFKRGPQSIGKLSPAQPALATATPPSVTFPKKAWDKLTPAEKKATNAKKQKASKAGKQFVANTTSAKSARSRSTLGKSKAV